MNKNNKTRVLRYLLAASGLVLCYSDLMAAENCSDEYYVDETLPNGARWDMCWEHRDREGIIFHHINYTPKDGERRLILKHAAVAQIHVPYDDNGARYHDISDFGIGSRNMLDLGTGECLSGELLKFGSKDVLCQQIKKHDFAYKSGNNSLSGHSLNLFSVSPVGAYFYIPNWRFKDDGTIEPWIGATGALQRYSNNQNRGWEIGDGRTGIAHLHNFFWKLDFDLNTTANNDVVEEFNFPIVDGKRKRSVTAFSIEAKRKVNPNSMRRWRVRDAATKNANNHAISYDILLSETGHQDIGPTSERFTHNDFYVTKENSDEKFASHNPAGAENLDAFVNNESITGEDIVIWAGVTFYHMPRSEDAPYMDAHWSHISIIPRDWHASNPLAEVVSNTPPVVIAPAEQSTSVGSPVNLSIEASDIDSTDLSYAATGLPAGLSINASTGVISGTASTAGDYNPSITVSDADDSTTVSFAWTVTNVVNAAPQLTMPANREGRVGDVVSLAVTATDAENDSLTYRATGLPAGLEINANTGLISGSLSAVGSNTVTLIVADGSSEASGQFTWNVAAASNSVGNEVANTAISIDGQLSDWSDVTFYANDPADAAGENNQIDWLKVGIAHSPQNVYLGYENRQNIDPNTASGSNIPWGWQAFLDTDINAATGYEDEGIGADYLIEGNIIYRYSGDGATWSWENIGTAELKYNGKTVEMVFSRSLIGTPESMRLLFKGSNDAFGGSGVDRYPDSGSLNYNFTGSSSPNTRPIADDQQVSVSYNNAFSLVLTGSDADNDSLLYNISQQPSNGTLSGSAPNIVYTPNNNYTGTDQFKFKVNDGAIDSFEATVSITVEQGSTGGAVSNFVVDPITIDANIAEWANLNHFADDPDDASGSIDWKNTALAHNDQTLFVLYNNRNAIGTGSYLAWGWQTYLDVDKNGATGFKLGATGADFLIEGNQVLRYTGSGTNWSWENVGTADVQYAGNSAELSLPRSIIGNPNAVRVSFAGDSSAYQEQGVDAYPDSSASFFEYEFSGDGSGADRPVAYSQVVAVTSGQTASITLLGTDNDNDALTYSIAANPSHGSLSGTAPNVVYTPDVGFVGQDSFTFSVNDGDLESATVTVTINVTGEQLGDVSNLVSSIDVNGNNEEWAGLTAFIDDSIDATGADSVIDWHRAAIAHNADNFYLMYQTHGLINPENNNGDFLNWGWQVYLDTDTNADTGYKIGDIGADYIIEGRQLQRYTGTSNSWSWELVNPAQLQYNTNTAELGLARGDIGNPDKLHLVFVGNNESYGGTQVDNYPNDLQHFSYKFSGGATVAQRRPRAIEKNVAVKANTILVMNLDGSDADNDTLSYRIVEQPQNGKIISIAADGKNLNYKPNTDYIGDDSFSFVVSDGVFDSSVSRVRMVISETGGVAPADTPNISSSGGGSLPYGILSLLGMVALLRRIIRNKDND